eukprot:COSAG06_NODE_2516_length_6733_cov_25.155261_3_plen_134_part_00
MASSSSSQRRLELLYNHVTTASLVSATASTRLLRSAWRHNSFELSDRPVAPRGHRVLTEADHEFLAEHGWLLVRGAVPPETVARCVGDTWAFLRERWGMLHDEPSTWYHPRRGTPQAGQRWYIDQSYQIVTQQ